MSYDIYFVPARSEYSWDEIMEEREAAADLSRGVPAALVEAWDRITPQVEAITGELELSRSADALQLSEEGTGIDLAIFDDEVSLAVPYWHDGDGAARVFRTIMAIVSVVERETGLVAFDPQTQKRFLASVEAAVSVMSANTRDLRSRYGD
ncbi:hypothetical protein [Streptomyces sp. NBC_00448]|uniref:hypothetical protein n=1 Tax=Streptomyces sp. NBC_00448 TaxID=2903652 RepID=UPI002E1F8A3B